MSIWLVRCACEYVFIVKYWWRSFALFCISVDVSLSYCVSFIQSYCFILNFVHQYLDFFYSVDWIYEGFCIDFCQFVYCFFFFWCSANNEMLVCMCVCVFVNTREKKEKYGFFKITNYELIGHLYFSIESAFSFFN